MLCGGLIITACLLLLGAMVWAFVKAPLGWQDDERGFAHGEPGEG